MPQLTNEDQAAIQQLWQAYGEAWARRDAAACAALYAPDGDAVAADGEYCNSPAEIERYYEGHLSGPYKDLAITDVVLDPARAVAPGVALMNGAWLVHGFRTPAGEQLPPVRMRSTFLVRRDPGGWRFVAARFAAPLTVGT